MLRSDLCRCGCLDWCALWVVLGFSILDRGSARRGCHAEDEARRHALDHGRTGTVYNELANASMRGVVAKVNGRLGRVLSTRSVCNAEVTCFILVSRTTRLGKTSQRWAMQNLGWPPCAASSPADHDNACAICEVWVVIPEQRTHALLIGMLRNESKVCRRGRSASE